MNEKIKTKKKNVQMADIFFFLNHYVYMGR